MKYKVIGINDDKDFCECCGKTGLKSVVWIENLETNEVKHFGSVCAKAPVKGFGLDKEINQAAYSWKQTLQMRSRKAMRIYKDKGGKMVAINNYTLDVADKALYDICLQEAA